MKRILLQPFRFPLYVAFGEKDFTAFTRVMCSDRSYTLEKASRADASTHYWDECVPARFGIWFNEGALSRPREHVMKWLPGTIAHEAHHVVDHVDKFIGESRKTDEIHAYLLTSIVNPVWQEWLRLTKEKK